MRALAHVDLGAVERNCATLKRRLGDARAVRGREGRRLRPRRHRVRARRARRRRDLAGGRDRRGGGRAARGRDRRTAARDGRADGAELAVALEAGADVVAWREEFVRAAEAAAAPSRPARVHVKLDTGMGRLGAKDPDAGARGRGRGRRVRAAGAGRRDDPLRDRRRAGRRTSSTSSCARFRPFARGGEAGASGLHRARREQRRRAAQRGRALRHGALRDRRLRDGSVRRGPGAQRPRAGARAAVVRGRREGAARRASRSATAAPGRRPTQTRVAVLPIGYGDGYRRGLSNARRGADPRAPLSRRRHDQHGQHHRRRGRRRGRDRRRRDADRRGRRRARDAPRSWRARSARSTTRSRAASPRACRACT